MSGLEWGLILLQVCHQLMPLHCRASDLCAHPQRDANGVPPVLALCHNPRKKQQMETGPPPSPPLSHTHFPPTLGTPPPSCRPNSTLGKVYLCFFCWNFGHSVMRQGNSWLLNWASHRLRLTVPEQRVISDPQETKGGTQFWHTTRPKWSGKKRLQKIRKVLDNREPVTATPTPTATSQHQSSSSPASRGNNKRPGEASTVLPPCSLSVFSSTQPRTSCHH